MAAIHHWRLLRHPTPCYPNYLGKRLMGYPRVHVEHRMVVAVVMELLMESNISAIRILVASEIFVQPEGVDV